MTTNTACTVFNTYKIGNVTYYQRTIIPRVYWELTTQIDTTTDSANATNTTILVIPYPANVSGKAYILASGFQRLQDKTQTWTLQKGDRIVKGVVDIDIVSSIIEIDNNPALEVATIYQFSLKDFGSKTLQHWEVLAK